MLRFHRLLLSALRHALPIGLSGILLLLAACSPSSGPSTGGTAKSGQPTRSLTIALASDITTLDPHMTQTVANDQSVHSHIYSSLVTIGPDMKLQGQVAESWQATSDTSWRFKLRSNVTFSNGEKLDANAVKWNIERIINPDTKARIKPWLDDVAEVRVVDDTTIDVITKTPAPTLPNVWSRVYLLSPQWVAAKNPAAEAMGSGPYTLREWVKDDHVTLELRPNYWGPQPAFKSVTFRAIPEVSSRMAALQAGDVDIITGVAPADIDRLNSSGSVTAGATPSIRMAFVKFNTLKKPLDDVRVRQALNYAVDKDSIIKNILNGTTKSAGQTLTDAYVGHNPDLQPYPYDPAKAKELLAEAAPGGVELEFDIPSGQYLLGEQISQAIAGQLAQVGVRAKMTEMPFSVYMNKYLAEQNLAHLAYITQAQASLDTGTLLLLFTSGNQYAYWNDQQFTDLVKRANTTMDVSQRGELYKQAMARMHDQAPVLFLFPQPATYAVSNTLNWTARPDDWVRAMDVQPK